MRTMHAIVAGLLVLGATLAAQQAPDAPNRGGRGRGVVITSPRDAYPARPPADPAVIERGRALYSVNCSLCHGADTRGGDTGPSLLRSGLVLDDQDGELIAPAVRSGRPDRGMPTFSFTDAQVTDLAAFLHSFKAAGYDESRNPPPEIVVGNGKAGETYFREKCSSCHSPTGDLAGFALKIRDPKTLQQTWLMPGSGGRGANPLPIPVRPARVTVTLPAGQKLEGELQRLDDFVVAFLEADGSHRSVRIDTGVKVAVSDPLQSHKDLLKVYTDADIHNVTAFLMTLK